MANPVTPVQLAATNILASEKNVLGRRNPINHGADLPKDRVTVTVTVTDTDLSGVKYTKVVASSLDERAAGEILSNRITISPDDLKDIGSIYNNHGGDAFETSAMAQIKESANAVLSTTSLNQNEIKHLLVVRVVL